MLLLCHVSALVLNNKPMNENIENNLCMYIFCKVGVECDRERTFQIKTDQLLLL